LGTISGRVPTDVGIGVTLHVGEYVKYGVMKHDPPMLTIPGVAFTVGTACEIAVAASVQDVMSLISSSAPVAPVNPAKALAPTVLARFTTVVTNGVAGLVFVLDANTCRVLVDGS
jgi:hypothetical protein